MVSEKGSMKTTCIYSMDLKEREKNVFLFI